MRPVLQLLAKGKVLRGTLFDPFGRSAERRMERALIEQYESRVREMLVDVLPTLQPKQWPTLLDLLTLPLSMRGFGHVKLRNIQAANQREKWLLNRLFPTRYERPDVRLTVGHLRGISVVRDH